MDVRKLLRCGLERDNKAILRYVQGWWSYQLYQGFLYQGKNGVVIKSNSAKICFINLPI